MNTVSGSCVQCVYVNALLFSRWFTLGAGAGHGVSTLGSSDTSGRLSPVRWPCVGVGGRSLGPGAEKLPVPFGLTSSGWVVQGGAQAPRPHP